MRYAVILNEYNVQRQLIEQTMLEEAITMIESHEKHRNNKTKLFWNNLPIKKTMKKRSTKRSELSFSLGEEDRRQENRSRHELLIVRRHSDQHEAVPNDPQQQSRQQGPRYGGKSTLKARSAQLKDQFF